MTRKLDPEHTQAIAIHLPQYHPTADNDEWWGKGFTEWTNVSKAKPLFPGHYQPHLPSDLGFYDLRLAEARAAQAEMARAYGISAFCYYHYWFHGRRILERPVEEILASGEPDFPFCLCWANEGWTRTWDLKDREVLIEQKYSPEDDREHIKSLIPLLSDPRYLRIDGKPALFVYRTEQLPDPSATAAIWREEVQKAGLPGLYLGAFVTSGVNLEAWGFDVAVEFVPSPFEQKKSRALKRIATRMWCKLNASLRGATQMAFHLYDDLVDGRSSSPRPENVAEGSWLRCVTPGWDNSARRKKRAQVFVGSTPAKYHAWLKNMVRWTRKNVPRDQRFVFINAWNEWAEGNHLEPDQKYGHAYLEATRDALAQGNAEEDAAR